MPQTVASSFKRVSLSVLIILAAALPILADAVGDGIAWDVSRPLSWGDFLGTAPADAVNRNEPAAIHMTIHWRVSYSATSANGRTWTGRVGSAEVTNTMSPTLSWSVPGKLDALILTHEQTHFDLNEVYRRKLERALLCVQTQGSAEQGVLDALNAQVHSMAGILLNRLVDIQAQYDAESSHGLDQAAQLRWQEQIARWLIDPALAPS
ncbi:hypothetical protein KJ567_00155 [Candidatus Bipolaricaulota bacterium]|nr:hypothetical protein [Candidatus Bipolaricaulota bacterium]